MPSSFCWKVSWAVLGCESLGRSGAVPWSVAARFTPYTNDCRLGEASHPGPGSLREASKMLVSDGRQHLGSTFAEAYADTNFRERMLKRPRPTAENMLALWNYFRACEAKDCLTGLISEPARKQGKKERKAEMAAERLNWKIVPFVPKGGAASSGEPFAAPRGASNSDPAWDWWRWIHMTVKVAWFSTSWRRLLLIILVPTLFPHILDALCEISADRIVVAACAFLTAFGDAIARAFTTMATTASRRWTLMDQAVGQFLLSVVGLWPQQKALPSPQALPPEVLEEIKQNNATVIYLQSPVAPDPPYPPILQLFASFGALAAAVVVSRLARGGGGI